MTGSRPYSDYKPSGLAWLGRVPRHWSIQPLATCFYERRETVSDKDFTPLSVTKNGIVPQLDTAAKTDNGDNRKRVNRGDFVINSRSDRKGSAGVSGLDGSVSVISTVLRPRARLDSRFVHYLLRSQPFQEEYYRFGTGIVADLWSTRYSAMKRIMLAIPPFVEQQFIACFLDRETAQIDDLISKQDKLIELLAEKRQALVMAYVANAVQPKIDDSGIRLKNIYSIVDERAKGADLPLMSVSIHRGLQRREVTTDDEPRADDLSNYKVCRLGDIVLNRMRAFQGALGGASETGLVSPDYLVVRPHQWIEPGWLEMVLRSNWAISEMQSRLRGIGSIDQGTIRTPRINAADLGEIRICVPPIGTQRVTLEEMRAAGQRISLLSSKCTTAVGLLRERRAALISAAVTGKVNVTNEGVAA